MPKSDKTVKILAKVLETHAEKNEYKPYYTCLGFDHLYLELEVPASELRKETENGQAIDVLTLEGWKALLRSYTRKIAEIDKDAADALPRFQPPVR